jgi:hypothetical protein
MYNVKYFMKYHKRVLNLLVLPCLKKRERERESLKWSSCDRGVILVCCQSKDGRR